MVTRDALKSEIDKVQEEWHLFIDEFAGCLSSDPIVRGPQGHYEVREALE